MLSVEDALSAVLSRVSLLSAERVSLAVASARVLAEDVTADVANPPFDNAAVDGYAVRAADTAGASRESPVILSDIGEVAAGRTASAEVISGCCMRVMTGAPIPAGADAMVMREDAEVSDGTVRVRLPAGPGDHIRRAGNDFHQDDVVLRTGVRLGPPEIAMLAAVGRGEISVYRRPRVAVFSTGDELVDVGIRPGPGQIRDSNRHTLEALARDAGGEIAISRRIEDDLDATIHAFGEAAGLGGAEPVDVIVTAGGVSVGDRDFVKPALERLGELDLWRVRMKPGKPLAFGRVGTSLFFGLPGNPVSTMVTFELFVRPALRKLSGFTELDRPRIRVRIDGSIDHHPGRREYVRARVRLENDTFVAAATGAQGSGMLTSMLGANALILVPEDSLGLNAGDIAEALLIDDLLMGPSA